MASNDKNGNPLAVGDAVSISGHVKSITSDNVVVIESDELDYPSTTAFKDLTVSPRIVVLS